MNKIQYLNINKTLEKVDETVLKVGNRAFNYGDGFFETIHANGTKPQFLFEHYERLKRACQTLNMELPFDQDGMEIEIVKLLNKNRIYKGARVRVTVFRKEGGLYTPLSSESSFLMQTTPLPSDRYQLSHNGLKVGVFKELTKPINKLSQFKTLNALLFVLAGIYKKENQLDDCVVLNDRGEVCEGISSNIFFVKEKVLVTPPLSSGCVAGIMRLKVMEIARFIGYKVLEQSIFPEEIGSYEEVFFTNAVHGVSWVVAYKEHRFYSFTAQKINQGLNDIAFL